MGLVKSYLSPTKPQTSQDSEKIPPSEMRASFLADMVSAEAAIRNCGYTSMGDYRGFKI